MINYRDFLIWCKNHNISLIQIKSTSEIANLYTQKIISYNKSRLVIDSFLCSKIVDNSLRMTVNDLF